MTRSLTFESTLPAYIHTAGPMHEYICPRCSQAFYTSEEMDQNTAPCPFCMKTNKIMTKADELLQQHEEISERERQLDIKRNG